MSRGPAPSRQDGVPVDTERVAERDLERGNGARDAASGGVEDVVIDFDETHLVADRPATPLPAPPIDASASGHEELVSRETHLRLRADFDNLSKRIERERADIYLHATSRLTSRLLPVLDNFERAIAAGRLPGGTAALLEGVELVQRQLIDELRGEGLRDIDAMGLAFDPEVHEAVASEPSSAVPPNSVVEVMRRGYFFHERVLRPALVRVSAETEEPDGRDERRED